MFEILSSHPQFVSVGFLELRLEECYITVQNTINEAAPVPHLQRSAIKF